jgi:superfamily II DNA or RNA helicase/SAM-dependent methyltransferase
MDLLVHPFEFIGAKRLYEEGRLLLADEMGMFKTAQAIFANNKVRQHRRRANTLVICPNSVKEHWQREVERWAYPKRQSITIIDAQNYDPSIGRAKDSDWVIINYPLISRFDRERADYFSSLGFRHVILDEVHNAKNPEACRTRVVKTIADRAEYLSLLSGTPIPNTIEDIYMLMSFLEPDKYPIEFDGKDVAREARRRFVDLYMQNPQVVKDLLHRRMLRREISDYLGKKVPSLLVDELYGIELSGQQLDVYNEILEQELTPGKKIKQLEKAMLDPSIVDRSLLKDPSILEGIKSLKYAALDEIIGRDAQKGKVLIFTNLKTGIVGRLVDRYSGYGAIAITGDIPACAYGEREKLRRKFQRDDSCRVLLATTTMNEGVDLTAATTVVDLTIPWTPAERSQRVRRSQRIGEIEKEAVRRYTLVAKLPKFKSLDQAMLEMLEGKERAIDYMLSGIRLSREELMELQGPQKIPRIRKVIRAPNQTIFCYYVNWRGVGTERALKRLHRKNSPSGMIAELYPNFSMAYNAARLYIPLVENAKSYPVLDLAGGPGMFSHLSREPSILVDLDLSMLKKAGEVSPLAKPVAGSMGSIPLQNESAGSVVCSLAYQMTEPYQERARALREMNRVLRPGGYAFIIMPGNYLSRANSARFDAAISSNGFEKVYHGTNQGSSKLDVYSLKKTAPAGDGRLSLRFRGDVHDK